MSMNMKSHVRKRSPLRVLFIIFIIALIMAGLLFAGLYIYGIRYLRYPVDSTSDGNTVYIKFIGLVDDEGNPYRGKIIYTNGLTADVNLETGKITYSNGDVYEGSLKRLEKDGKGKLTYANGDVYEGDFVSGELTGVGKYTYS
ncbi:MAG: hypothetical protein GX192_08195, partial [Clostridiales bacterium]|nr:hypothetical protein [Clostridiales bacterium]